MKYTTNDNFKRINEEYPAKGNWIEETKLDFECSLSEENAIFLANEIFEKIRPTDTFYENFNLKSIWNDKKDELWILYYNEEIPAIASGITMVFSKNNCELRGIYTEE